MSDGYVQTIPSRGEFFAVCCWCGMLDTPDRASESEAVADLAGHMAHAHPRFVAPEVLAAREHAQPWKDKP